MSGAGGGFGRHLIGAMYAPSSWTPPQLMQAALAFAPLHDP